MPNSSDAQDYDLSAIEAAVRETARGRAFLASYARRVRQSDTLTMMAMIARLERWCQQQSVRFAELDADLKISQKRVDDGQLGQEINPSDKRGSDDFIDEILDGHSIINIRAIDHSQRLSEVEISKAEALVRLQEVTSAICDLDRRANDLVARPGTSSPSIGRAYTESSRSTAIPTRDVVLSQTELQKDSADESILDNIAKALAK